MSVVLTVVMLPLYVGDGDELKILNCRFIVTSVSASDTDHRPVQDTSIHTFAIKYF